MSCTDIFIESSSFHPSLAGVLALSILGVAEGEIEYYKPHSTVMIFDILTAELSNKGHSHS